MQFSFVAAVLLLSQAVVNVSAKAVFAHYMVSNTKTFTEADWENDIRNAMAAGIDAFAMNMAANESTTETSLPKAFKVAAAKGFKLFFSFDYAGNGPWDKKVVTNMINLYKLSDAYFYRGSQPLVSTFEGPENAPDWKEIKEDTKCFFIPDWSSLGARDAMALGTADGLFGWAAWPKGPRNTDTYEDASYFDFLKGKPYMAAVSPWFYTNLPGYNKNWLWRGDDLWFDRWQQLIFGEYQPEYIQIISWNDFGESHYIGPLPNNEEAYVAFKTGRAPFDFVKDYVHDGWTNFLPYTISLWKTGTGSIKQEGAVCWYRLTSATACPSGGTTGNTASHLQLEYPPEQVVQDKIFFSAQLGSDATVQVTIGGVSIAADWTSKPHGGVGIYHGSVPTNGLTGPVKVHVYRGSSLVVRIDGQTIYGSCKDGINNFNAWVGFNWGDTIAAKSPPLKISQMKCTAGFGANNFDGLCRFTCRYGYCPESACTCSEMGPGNKLPEATGDSGFPLPGASPAYGGLCSFACNYGYCPPTACGSVDAGTSVPNTSPFLPPTCNGGVGTGSYAGLCSYACNWGFCPLHACTCTSTGPLNVPPPKEAGIVGYASDGSQDFGLCQFACERNDYCPEPCKSYKKSSFEFPGGGFIELPGGIDYGEMSGGLLSIEKWYTRIQMDDQLSKTTSEILGDLPCIRLRRRSEALRKRNSVDPKDVEAAVEMLILNDRFFIDFMDHYFQRTIPGVIQSFESLPQWVETVAQAAFEESFVSATSLIYSRLVPYAPQAAITSAAVWLLYGTVDIAVQKLLACPKDFKSFALSTKGAMKKTCPRAKDDMPCSHPQCKGKNEVCTGTLKGCPCHKTDCDDMDGSLFCPECGGQDSESGACLGQSGTGKYKDCPCLKPYEFEEEESLWISNEWKEILEDDDYEAPTNKGICYKRRTGVKEDPTKWRFAYRHYITAFRVVESFCGFIGNLNGPAGGSRNMNYLSELGYDEVNLKIEWETDTVMKQDVCIKHLNSILDCDKSTTENQYGFVWGGEVDTGMVKFSLTPLRTRAAIRNDPATDWWRLGDSRHWRTVNKKVDSGKPKIGKNGKEYDMIVLHQCLAYMRYVEFDGGKPHDCNGLANFSMSQRNGYQFSNHCHDNTWEMVSWSLLETGDVALYGEHQGGAMGPAGAKCWMGIDSW